MPCFSCKCFSDANGRWGEQLNGGRGYCKLHDQEYWRGHECRDYAPVWYYPVAYDSSLKEQAGFGKLSLSAKNKENDILLLMSSDVVLSEIYEDEEAFEDTASKVRKKPVKNKNKAESKIRKSMKTCTWICFVLTLVYAWLAIIIDELCCFAGVSFFTVLSVMFLLLGLTAKETPFC